VRRRIEEGVEEVDGRGEPGRRRRGAGWPAAARGKKGRARPEVEGGADRWAPPVGDRVREREGREAERAAWAETEVGRELGWVGLAVFFFFLFFSFQIQFQTYFKSFKFKSFSSFQIEILTQIYSNILRLLENFFKHF
jgi:hypothetical protein